MFQNNFNYGDYDFKQLIWKNNDRSNWLKKCKQKYMGDIFDMKSYSSKIGYK